MNFTEVATRPYIQIQKSAPGPPEMIAVATPAMLPVPIEAPSAVMNAWKGVSTPPADDDCCATMARNASGRRLNWTNR